MQTNNNDVCRFGETNGFGQMGSNPKSEVGITGHGGSGLGHTALYDDRQHRIWGLTMSIGLQRTETGSAGAQALDYDDCFNLLSNHRRRYTLHYLKQNGGTAELSELAEQLAAWENGIDRADVSYDQRKRVYTSLQQVHLPQMDDWGVVVFDERDGVATLAPAAEELDIYFEVVGRRDIPWSAFYLLLVLVNAAILGVGASGIGPLAAIPDIGWALFVLTTFLVVSLVHVYVTRTEMYLGGEEQPPEVTS